MAEPQNVFNLNCTPGIWRDWTSNSSTGWTDGEYCRFMEGRPMKIAGWQAVGELGLSNNSTPFSAQGEAVIGEALRLQVGTIRKIQTFPINGKFLIVVCADILGNMPGITTNIPTDTLVPSGIFIAISETDPIGHVVFYPVRFEKYYVTNEAGEPIVTGFSPGVYNWSVCIYGVTSGGEEATITALNPTGGGGNLSSLALIAHASFSVDDKSSPQNNYVFFGKISDMLDFTDPRNYAYDPNFVGFPDPATDDDKLSAQQYLYSPVMFPMTQNPVSGVTSPDAANVFIFPTPVDDRAIYCTSEVIVSGGVATAGPILFAYGNNGLIRNCSPNNPSLWANAGNPYWNYNPGLANDNNIDNFKVITASAVRGGAGLSVLCWTTNSLWLMQFTGDPKSIFSYTNISNSVSVMSQNVPIEANGVFFWVGEDRFYIYSGAIQPLVNQYNFIWFYQNLNYKNRSKMFSFKDPHFNEIWWVFPKGISTECNHAIVYNYVEQVWYDTPWDRTAGYYEQSYFKPLCCGGEITVPVNTEAATSFPSGASVPWFETAPATVTAKVIWIHDIGYNEVVGDKQRPYNSYITSCDIGMLNGGPAAGKGTYQGLSSFLYLDRIEPDLFATGEQYILISSREFPQDDLKTIDNLRYNKIDSPQKTQYLSVDKQGRMMYITFGCSSLNSSYYLGKPIVMTKLGDQK